jgi:hypothetical protein
MYEGRSESNASYFIMLAHYVRGSAGGMAVEVETFLPVVHMFCCCVTAAEGQSDKMASDMEVRTKQRCVIEFHHAEKLHPLTFNNAC